MRSPSARRRSRPPPWRRRGDASAHARDRARRLRAVHRRGADGCGAHAEPGARCAARSARFELEHGDAKRTGLAWEHVSLGTASGGGVALCGRALRPVALRGAAAGHRRRAAARAARPARRDLRRALLRSLARAELSGARLLGRARRGRRAQSRPPRSRQEIEARFGAVSRDVLHLRLRVARPRAHARDGRRARARRGRARRGRRAGSSPSAFPTGTSRCWW